MDISQDTNTVYLFLFGISILASFIDSIAGGGGLLTTPSMLLVGINPLTVLGTNKFQSSFSTFTSTRNYFCLLYTSPSPRDRTRSRMPSSA